MRTIRTWLNYHLHEPIGETNDQPSLTVPDETLSIREILVRYARGLPTGGQRVEIWDEEDDLPDPRTLDLADRQEIREALQEELLEIHKSVKNEKAKKVKTNESLPTGGNDGTSEPEDDNG